MKHTVPESPTHSMRVLVDRTVAATAALQALARVTTHLRRGGEGAPGVRPHLSHFRHRLGEVLETGPMVLQVGARSLVLDGKVVHSSARPEDSLAFGLYREGIRSVRIEPDAPWDEVMGLVEVIVLQAVCGPVSEEGATSRLRKLELTRVSFLRRSTRSSERHGPASGVDVAADRPGSWDPPVRSRAGRKPVLQQPVSDVARLRVQASAATGSLAQDCLALVDELQALLAPGGEGPGLRLAEFLPVVEEMRQALAVRGESVAVLSLLDRVRPLLPLAPEAVGSLLRRFSGPQLVLALVERAASEEEPDLAELERSIADLPGDPLPAYLLGLEERGSRRRRRLLVGLLSRHAVLRREELELAFEGASAGGAADILRALAIAHPYRRVALAWLALSRPEPVLVRVARLLLERAHPERGEVEALVAFLSMPILSVRTRVVGLLGRVGGDEVFEVLRSHLERGAGESVPVEEAALLGVTLARVSPERALGLFLEWVQPKGLWSRVLGGDVDQVLGIAAVSGLMELDPVDNEALVRRLASRTASPMRDHCERLLFPDDAQGHA